MYSPRRGTLPLPLSWLHLQHVEPGPGIEPADSSHPRHSSDNIKSSTYRATRELQPSLSAGAEGAQINIFSQNRGEDRMVQDGEPLEMVIHNANIIPYMHRKEEATFFPNSLIMLFLKFQITI